MPISIFDLTINVVEAVIFVLFLTRYFQMKKSFTMTYFILWVIFGAVGVTIMNIYLGYEKYFTFLISLGLYFPWLLVFAKGSVLEKGYISLFMIQLNATIITTNLILGSFIVYHGIEMAKILSEHYEVVVILCRLVYLVISQLIAHERRKLKSSSLQTTVVAGFAVFSIASSLIYTSLEDILYLNSVNLVDVAVALSGLLLLIISVFLVFFKLQVSNEKEIENELKIQSLNYQTNLNEVALEVNRETSKMRHDLKHLLSHMEFLLLENREEEALELVRSHYKSVQTEQKVILTPNEVVNYILNTKNSVALEKNLSMRFIINFQREPKIPDVDLAILLGNAIDNAIENCAGESVEVRIEDKNEYLHIVVSNSIAKSVLKENVNLETTKKQKGHGYGIGSIKEIAYRNDGNIEFYEKNNRFFCSILIK
ncbi:MULTISPECIES: sensor histidine kinase [unclassified Breznakia]|uniref:sensor histidine kinase n=1 Tax=unclassified Breznakia TaxID=2623764 RepID=UPI002404CCBA|nr:MULTISPECIES: sensor histidine kinase [unclassified Breznakia]MDF9838348.1 two-component system sensor histidine kinase AgrC [Breznakia sp. PFB2-8]MDF9860360.1 two-component system sensor histidine kinase AgrC [Breznakia sp. PH5-24]